MTNGVSSLMHHTDQWTGWIVKCCQKAPHTVRKKITRIHQITIILPGCTYDPKGQPNHTHMVHQMSVNTPSTIGPFVSASKFVIRQKKGRIFFIFREPSNKRYAQRGRCQSHKSMHQKDNHPLATSPFQQTHNSGTRKITPGTKDHHSKATRPSTPQDTNQVSDPSNQRWVKAHVGDPNL